MASQISSGKRISSAALIAVSAMLLVSCTAVAPESPNGVEPSATSASEQPPVLNSATESCDVTTDRFAMVTDFLRGNIAEDESIRRKAGQKIIKVGIEMQSEYSVEQKLTETIHSLGKSAVALGEALSLTGKFDSISDELKPVLDDYSLELTEFQSRCDALLD